MSRPEAPRAVRDDAPPATATLTLRRFVPGDAAKVFAMSREDGIRTWIPDQVYGDETEAATVLAQLIARVRDPGTPRRAPYVLAICRAGAEEPVGHAGLSPLDGEVEVGFAIEHRWQRCGLATAAVRQLVQWSLGRFALPRVIGVVADDNAASWRVLERVGFVLASRVSGTLHGRAGLVRTYRFGPAADAPVGAARRERR
jgi:ribosomal-protein-alanine N-acetyltransferase